MISSLTTKKLKLQTSNCDMLSFCQSVDHLLIGL